ncbi:hypothetical protein BGZ47_004327, partial [Haplosporangium gracile]
MRPFYTQSFHDKHDSSVDQDWEWYYDRLLTSHDDHDTRNEDPGYTGSDGYYRIPQPRTHRQTPHQDTDYARRGLRKTEKAYIPPPTGKGRRRRGRKGKGDLFEHDYHAGYSKPEILAMSSERKATFEAQ